MSVKNYNDYELLYLTKRSNERALEIIYEKYKLYLYYKLRVYNFDNEFIEDIVQDCLFELSKSIKRYDESRNILFFTFVETIFDRKIKKSLIKLYRDKEIIEYCIEKESRNLSDISCKYETIEMTKKVEEDLNNLMSHLLLKEKLVFKEIMLGKCSIKNYALKYDVTHKQIYNHIQSIRGKYLKFCKTRKK